MSQLMIEFYKLHTAEPGLPKAALLRRAQLKLLGGGAGTSASTSLAHPHYWAPFVLYGGFR
jgi:CHAT domain-containing protein